MKPFLCIGHRGAAGLEPENTLLSIRRALELGARGIEIDVRLSLDGALMVIHDATLHRTTGVPGAVAERTFAELRKLNAGKGECIPTLREVMDEIVAFSSQQGRAPQSDAPVVPVWLNIELKGRGTAGPVEREIEAAVARGEWRYEDFTVSSFHYRELSRLQHPEVRVGVLIARAPLRLGGLLRRLRASSLHIAQRLATPRFFARIARVRAALAAGEDFEREERDASKLGGGVTGLSGPGFAVGKSLPLYVYTVNEREVMEQLRAQGVDGVFTDFPDRFPSTGDTEVEEGGQGSQPS